MGEIVYGICDRHEMLGRDGTCPWCEIEQIKSRTWVLVSERLPQPEVRVLACVVDSDTGQRWIIRAQYASQYTLEMHEYSAEEGDYDEATDTLYCKAGWYEDNEYEEVHWKVDEEVTHWMPLPELPHRGDE